MLGRQKDKRRGRGERRMEEGREGEKDRKKEKGGDVLNTRHYSFVILSLLLVLPFQCPFSLKSAH